MSASPVGLQKFIDICYNYSAQSSVTFNPTKSVFVVFKPNKFKLYCPLLVSNAAPLSYVDSVKYLGCMFTLTPRTMLTCRGNCELFMLVVTSLYAILLNVIRLSS